MIARVVDGSRFDEFKPLYGTSLVTGWASIHGYPDRHPRQPPRHAVHRRSPTRRRSSSSWRTRWTRPLLFLQNTTGYMVGKDYEQRGIIKDGAKMINAVSNSQVPHLTVNIGASYGAGNYGMCGRAYNPRFLFSWPNARSAVMGPAQLAGVLSIVARQGAEARGEVVRRGSGRGDARRRSRRRSTRESMPLFLTGTPVRRRDNRSP